MAAAITVSGLTKSYKDTEVLKGVDFSVERGQVFALLGSNGAGKTTTINILTTLIPATGGSASVQGYDVATQPDKVRRSISLTGQFAAVDDILTGRENLQLIAGLRHVGNPAQVATDLLAKFDLTEAADRRAQTYSGGMRRRLDIAMGLIGNPPVIFLDEPTTGLDPEARKDMWQTIKTLAQNGTTIFLTTQYLDEADALADRVAILHGGTIVANDEPQNLKKQLPSWKVKMVEQQPTLDDVFAHFTKSPSSQPLSTSSQLPSPSSQRRLGSSSNNTGEASNHRLDSRRSLPSTTFGGGNDESLKEEK